ncbi:MAG TPA: MGMT family protein [Thermomicrobiales bacterium]|nr:MGMT family protein [Thermomicrobiales bacterium]
MSLDDKKNAPGADEIPFPERVYRVVKRIPPGRVTTYGTIAAYLGNRRAARMVGWALNGSPEDVGEHAHRVVNRYGQLSGGWHFGHPDVMKQLLEDEGVSFVDEYQVDIKRHLWVPELEGQD